MWEWEGHLGSNKISDQRKTCHKPICFHYRYLNTKYCLPRNHWRGMIKFFHSNKIPTCLCRPYSAFFLACWKANQPTRRSTILTRMISELLVPDEEITLWNGASLELETQRKLEICGTNTRQVTHREKVVKQSHGCLLFCTSFSGTLTKRQRRNKPETFQNTEKSA